jgi:GT2 family glycosyltransferase
VPPDAMTIAPVQHRKTVTLTPLDVLDLSVVIVNWNTRQVIDECLASVYAHLDDLRAEVIVIDNASTDDSVTHIRQHYPHVRLICNAKNNGFAGANNQGMAVARGRYICLLNPDTVVLDDVFHRTIELADAHSTIGVVGCQVWESRRAIQRTCFRYPSPLNTLMWVSGFSAWFPTHDLFGRAAYGRWTRQDMRDVNVVSGMYMLVKREAIDQVGLMDPDYFVFAEEADWCHRFTAAGWRCVFAPVGRILHVDGGSKSTQQASVKMYVEMQKNILQFHARRRSRFDWLLCAVLFAVSMPLRGVWWSTVSALVRGPMARHKARQSWAATAFHWFRREPCW